MKTYLKLLKKYEDISEKKSGLIITVSGLSGSGKTVVAEEIARVFNLKLINAGDLFREYAHQKNLSLDKTSKSLPMAIDHQIDKMTLTLAQKGGCVLVGRLSAWVAGEWADCRIFVQCLKKVRDRRIAARDNLSLSDARINVRDRDERDLLRYKKIYGINLKDKTIYNLVIHNNEITLPKLKREVIKKIKDFLKK